MAAKHGRWAALFDAAKRNAPGLIFVGGPVGSAVLVGPATAAMVIVGVLVAVVIWYTPPESRSGTAERLLLTLIPWARKPKGKGKPKGLK